jgi:trimeric autotransporter adhesin
MLDLIIESVAIFCVFGGTMNLASPTPILNTFETSNRGTSVFSSELVPSRRQKTLASVWLMMLSCVATLFALTASAQTNIIHTIAGGALPNTVATSADIPGPTSAVADASGNVYITAPYSYYMFKVTGTQLNVIAGKGFHGYSGNGTPAIKALLGAPNGAAMDAQGNLYFSDWGANRIRKIDTSGNITTVAGNGKPCHRKTACGDGGPATDAELGSPQALTIDSTGNIFIADTGSERIREVNTQGIINTIAGNGSICNGPNFQCGDGGPGPAAHLDLPTGVAVDNAGHVYIGDTKDQRIRMVDLSTGIITTVVGWKNRGKICSVSTQKCGDRGPLNRVQFRNPRGIALDRTGKLLYIADSSDNRIRVANFGTNAMATVAGTGVRGFSGDGGVDSQAELDTPYGISLDSVGNLITSDTGNQRVRTVKRRIINTVAGGGLGNDGGLAKSANLANPNAVVWAGARHYYIADAANNRIREVISGRISTAVGTGDAGWSGDGGPATSATLSNPLGVTVDGSGDIFIADTSNVIVREVVNGTITTIAGNGNVCFPTTDLCGDGGPATQALLSSPTTTAVDSAGNVYIADPVGNRIRKVDSTGTINTIAGTGVAGYNGDAIPASQALINHPYGVAVDSSGNIYIADTNNNRIRCVLVVANGCGGSPEPVGYIITFALNGKGGFQGEKGGGQATDASMEHPFQVALDPSGNVYFGGGVYQVVCKVDTTTQHIITTVAGNILDPGKQGFAGDGGPATQATLDNSGLSIDGNGNLLIADQGNNRIREVPLGTASQR